MYSLFEKLGPIFDWCREGLFGMAKVLSLVVLIVSGSGCGGAGGAGGAVQVLFLLHIFSIIIGFQSGGEDSPSPPPAPPLSVVFPSDDCILGSTNASGTNCVTDIKIGGTSLGKERIDSGAFVDNTKEEKDRLRFQIGAPGILTIWTEGVATAARNASTRIHYLNNESAADATVTYLGIDPDTGGNVSVVKENNYTSGVRSLGSTHGILQLEVTNTALFYHILVETVENGSYVVVINFAPTMSRGDTTAVNNPDADSDEDGIQHSADNCPVSHNPSQIDSDEDDLGDPCDIDDNGNGLIELRTAVELHNVRYVLNGSGYQAGENEALDQAGCGGLNSVNRCRGYELIADISLYSYGEDLGWQPIGAGCTSQVPTDTTQNNYFRTIFEGNGYVISNMTINRIREDCIGLFGALGSAATIRNVHLAAVSVEGNNSVGGLVGAAHNATIISSSIEGGRIKGNGGSVGGLVGNGKRATIISSSSFVGSVSGNNSVGGLVGDGRNITITSSSSLVGSVSGNNFAGGLVGNGKRATIISSSSFVGSVSGNNSVGGLVGDGRNITITSSSSLVGSVSGNKHIGGLAGNGLRATITSSYSVAGSVSGNNSVGGLVGNEEKATITSSYWDNNTNDMTTGSNKDAPQSTSALQTPTNYTGIYATWDDRGCGWDFGSAVEYPALSCLPASPQQQRSYYGVVGGDVILLVDFDEDGIAYSSDSCPIGETSWMSNNETDNDEDGCRDTSEDMDDDDDGVFDDDDNGISPTDGTECRLLRDCDNDGIEDGDDNGISPTDGTECRLLRDCDDDGVPDGDDNGISPINGMECRLLEDCDNDGVPDGNDYGNKDGMECMLLRDCDYDGVMDGKDNCRVGENDWTSNDQTDNDDDGCRDLTEDIDDDGDGLIEIKTFEMLNNVRYVLNGTGYRDNETAAINRIGCGGLSDITSCSGYELVNNISLTSSMSDAIWLPLGGHGTRQPLPSCQGAAFSGIFDGNGYAVVNLSINRPDQDCVGLFGEVSGEIHNLGVTGDYISGGLYVGSLVGYGEDAIITNSSSLVGSVSGNQSVGGLVGYGGDAIITNSSSSVVHSVNGSDDHVGGLVGYGGDATIINSSSLVGSVNGNQDVGGLAGNGLRTTITSSSSFVSSVSGNKDVGGLVGYGEDAIITSSSSVIHSVNGSDEHVGGLVGHGRSVTIISSYSVVRSVSGNTSVGGLVGIGGLDTTITSSYSIAGSVSGDTFVGGLVGTGKRSTITSSYWDNNTNDITIGSTSAPQSTSALQTPTGYTGIYADWDDHGCGWSFGTTMEYPALLCLPASPQQQRSYYTVSGGNVTVNAPQF